MAAALVLLVAKTTFAAPVLPDSGQVSRELRLPLQVEPKARPEVIIDEPSKAKPDGDGVRFNIAAIRITGNRLIGNDELQPLISDLVGAEHSLADLDAGAARITALYRARGYVVARAYLPAQEIKDGVVRIAVIEGRIDKQQLNNQSRLSDQRANHYLSGLKKGDPVVAEPVDRALLLLNDTPGVGAARATLQPGASVGTSDLVINLEPGAPYAGSVELDNYGNRYTGENRLGGSFYLNSPLGIGDQLSLRVLGSDQDLTYGRVGYQIPVGGDGWRLGAAYADTHYRLGKDFTALKAHGNASSSSVFAVYPFIRSQATNLSGTVSWEEKKLSDAVDATTTITGKRAHIASFGLAGSHQDALGGGGFNAIDLSLVGGHLDIDSTIARLIDALSARTNGAYTRLAYSVSRLQRVDDLTLVSASISGQMSDTNLDSSEKFSLGGASGVRAYPQGEAIGDEGNLLNIELRHRFLKALQGVLFYDVGSVSINRKPFGTPASNHRTLSGTGIGANIDWFGMSIKACVAWRNQGGQATSVPANVHDNARAWLQVSRQF